MGRRQPPGLGLLDELERRPHRVRGIGEVEVDAIAEELHHAAAVACSDLVRQRGKVQRDLGGDLVAGLLGQTGEAGEVGEDRRLGRARRPFPHARILERRFDMIELMLGLGDLTMPAEEPAEEIFARVAHAQPDLPDRRLEGLVVIQAALSELLLDRGVEVVGQVAGDASHAIAPDAGEAQHLVLVDAGAEEHGEDPQYLEILLANALVRAWAEETEGDVYPLQRGERDADLLGHLGERPLRARVAPPGAFEIPERQLARRDGGGDAIGRDAERLELAKDADAHDVPAREGAVTRLDDPEVEQLPDLLRARLRARGKLVGAEPRGGAGHVRPTKAAGSATNASWQSSEQK